MSTELETRPNETAPAVEPAAADGPAPEAGAGLDGDETALAGRIVSSARWFYWVAALSLVNSIIVIAGGDWSFLFGLGTTQFVDGIVVLAVQEDPGAALFAKGLGLGIDLMIAGIYALFGWLAARRRTWAFAVGMILYAMDGMIFLFFRDFLGLAFHGWVLFSLFTGLHACYRQGRPSTRQAPRKAA